jgi:hypothetical protein
MLGEDLGLEPSSELCDLEARIVRGDIAVAFTSRVNAGIATTDNLPAPLTTFVGRATLQGEIKQAIAGLRRVGDQRSIASTLAGLGTIAVRGEMRIAPPPSSSRAWASAPASATTPGSPSATTGLPRCTVPSGSPVTPPRWSRRPRPADPAAMRVIGRAWPRSTPRWTHRRPETAVPDGRRR